MLFDAYPIWIQGAGDLATGVAARLWRSGFPVVLSELPQPLAIRRGAALAEAVYTGVWTVEDLTAQRARPAEVRDLWAAGRLPILTAPPDPTALGLFALVDARLAKRNLGTTPQAAPLVIGLGPGFQAPQDVHAVIETNRGHALGRVIWQGAAEPDTGAPGEVGGETVRRVLYAPTAGMFTPQQPIGAQVAVGETVGEVLTAAGEVAPVNAKLDGVLRGILHGGLKVTAGTKIGDVDPRAAPDHCFTISDKALAIGGGVLEAVLTWLNREDS